MVAEDRIESKTKVTITIFLVFAKTIPANTAIGTQRKMKNLYMSHGLGVKSMMLGIINKRIKVPFRIQFPRFTNETMANTKGTPRFKKK